jgi:hypothetical protein
MRLRFSVAVLLHAVVAIVGATTAWAHAGPVLGTNVSAPHATARAARPGTTRDPGAGLAVWRAGRWVTWWRRAAAPARWDAPLPVLRDAVGWTPSTPGVEWGELRLAGEGEAWRTRVVVVRVDPRRGARARGAGAQRRAVRRRRAVGLGRARRA